VQGPVNRREELNTRFLFRENVDPTARTPHCEKDMKKFPA
jgi:hypothetical protein